MLVENHKHKLFKIQFKLQIQFNLQIQFITLRYNIHIHYLFC